MAADKPRSMASTVVVSLVGLLAFVAAYVLSVGPAIWLYERGMLPLVEFWQAVYSPLDWLDDTPARGPIDAYADWWRR